MSRPRNLQRPHRARTGPASGETARRLVERDVRASSRVAARRIRGIRRAAGARRGPAGHEMKQFQNRLAGPVQRAPVADDILRAMPYRHPMTVRDVMAALRPNWRNYPAMRILLDRLVCHGWLVAVDLHRQSRSGSLAHCYKRVKALVT